MPVQIPGITDDWRKQSQNVYTRQVKNLADALEPVPPASHIVKSIIRSSSLSLWFGAPGSLKSATLMDLAVCVSAGKPWLQDELDDLPGFETVQCPVLWVDIDNGRDTTHERIKAFAKAHGIPADSEIFWHSFPEPVLCAKNGLATFVDHVLEVGAGLVCIDNLLRVSGIDDENSSKMDVAMTALKKICENTGAAVAIVHHKRKDSMGRDGDQIRGHSSIESSLDAGYMVSRPEDQDIVTVKHVKVRKRRIENFSAGFKYTHEADGETLHTARMFGIPPVDPNAEKLAKLEQEVITLLTRSPMANKAQITDYLRIRRSVVNELLDDMETKGIVISLKGPNNSILYQLRG